MRRTKNRHLLKGQNRLKRSGLLAWLKVFFIVVLLTLIGFYLYKADFLKIKVIEVKIANADCVNREDAVNVIRSQATNFLWVNSGLIEQKMKKRFLCVGKITTKKTFPQKVSSEIEGRAVAAIINVVNIPNPMSGLETLTATPSSQAATLETVVEQATPEGKYLVDRSGFIFADWQNQADLPEISVVMPDLALGRSIPDKIVDIALKVAEELKKLNLPIDKIIVTNQKLIFKSTPKLTFGFSEDQIRQVASLQLILQRAKMDSKSIESIDLSFDKPVVVYSTKKK